MKSVLFFRLINMFKKQINFKYLTIVFILNSSLLYAQNEDVEIDSLYLKKVENRPIIKLGTFWLLFYPNVRLEKRIHDKFALEGTFFHGLFSDKYATKYSTLGLDLKRYFDTPTFGYYSTLGFRYIKELPFIFLKTNQKYEFKPSLKLGLGCQILTPRLNSFDFEFGGLLLFNNIRRFSPIMKIAYGFSPQHFIGKDRAILKKLNL